MQMGQRGPLGDDRVKAPKLLTEKMGKSEKKSLETEERLLDDAPELVTEK